MDKPISPEQAIAAGYRTRLQRSPDGESWELVYDGPYRELEEDGGLIADTLYRYRAKNYTLPPREHESDWSEILSVRTQSEYVDPDFRFLAVVRKIEIQWKMMLRVAGLNVIYSQNDRNGEALRILNIFGLLSYPDSYTSPGGGGRTTDEKQQIVVRIEDMDGLIPRVGDTVKLQVREEEPKKYVVCDPPYMTIAYDTRYVIQLTRCTLSN